ncbi:hypothetical protein ACQJBY_013990 [Aegilops geniculata]
MDLRSSATRTSVPVLVFFGRRHCCHYHAVIVLVCPSTMYLINDCITYSPVVPADLRPRRVVVIVCIYLGLFFFFAGISWIVCTMLNNILDCSTGAKKLTCNTCACCLCTLFVPYVL